MQWLKIVEEWVQKVIGISPDLQAKIVGTLLIVFIIIALRKLLLQLIHRYNSNDVKAFYRWRNFTSYIGFFLGSLIIGRIWFSGFHSIITYLGILSAGIAFALQSPVVNLAGWIYIVLRRPFEVGDRIEIGKNAGDVVDVSLFQFTINEINNWIDGEQSTGRIIHIPNGKIFSEACANYTMGFYYIWNEIPIIITFESNWEKAKKILLDIAIEKTQQISQDAEVLFRQSQRKYLIIYSTFSPIVYVGVKENGICVTVRHICDPRRRRATAQLIWEEVLKEFRASPDIAFAYPTTRLYNHSIEGKEDLRNNTK
ncbi:MAG: mechanosensitive ion channel family protein [Bacteroidetes bacterium]|nr:mechanosensitive ion channel family protein [Bacteroidota bacterium]